jgi:microcystin-dependent protein
LTDDQMPSHHHELSVNGAAGGSNKPTNRSLGRLTQGSGYASTFNGTTLHPEAIVPAGGGHPHENRPPLLALNYCIALEGIFPTRE